MFKCRFLVEAGPPNFGKKPNGGNTPPTGKPATGGPVGQQSPKNPGVGAAPKPGGKPTGKPGGPPPDMGDDPMAEDPMGGMAPMGDGTAMMAMQAAQIEAEKEAEAQRQAAAEAEAAEREKIKQMRLEADSAVMDDLVDKNEDNDTVEFYPSFFDEFRDTLDKGLQGDKGKKDEDGDSDEEDTEEDIEDEDEEENPKKPSAKKSELKEKQADKSSAKSSKPVKKPVKK